MPDAASPPPHRVWTRLHRHTDALGLRRAMGGLALPGVVGAMAFLAALAAAGWVAAGALAQRWQAGAATVLTAQVPDPEAPAPTGGGTRLAVGVALLRGDPAVASARALSAAERTALLRPWFGGADPPDSLPLPGVIDARVLPGTTPEVFAALGRRLGAAVPAATIGSHADWTARLLDLAAALRACAGVALVVVAAVAALVVAVVVRSGLLARREAIEIVHGLGATDAYVARLFAGRATVQAASGAALGMIVALPLLLVLARMAQPFASPLAANAPEAAGMSSLVALPATLWLALMALPAAAAAIGFATTAVTVRRWLRRLP